MKTAPATEALSFETHLGDDAQKTSTRYETNPSDSVIQMCKFCRSSHLTNSTCYYKSKLAFGVDPTRQKLLLKCYPQTKTK